MPQLSVFLITDNPLADKLLNGVSLHQLALGEANSFCRANHAELIEVSAAKLLGAVQNSKSEIVVIHDLLHPLVNAAQFQRTFDALSGFDAVRPTMAFTETIKSVDQAGRLDQTIDRSQFRRISSPEVIRFSAIDFLGKKGTWSVPLIQNAQLSEVEADPKTIRINSESELEFFKALSALN